MTPPAHEALEEAVRRSYATLLSYLAPRAGGDLAAAEDALSEAMLAAIQQWSLRGVPLKPEAWLLSVAKKRLIDEQRLQHTRDHHREALQHSIEQAEQVAMSEDAFPDERLKLLFVCAHPAIEPTVRTPLMLQTVFGLDAKLIASVFLTAPATMSQRLVRAKTKIRDAGIPFRVPEPPEWEDRLACVLSAIYAAYTAGWDALADPNNPHATLAADAIALARLLNALLPDEPEALGLLALMLHCEARQAARFTADGAFVPLDEQDVTRWSASMIAEAESLLRQAATFQKPGRYQLEAAIQSVHAERASSGHLHWSAIATLYGLLLQLTPSLGARIGHAIALGKSGALTEALAALDALPQPSVLSYAPYWAARGYIERQLEHHPEADKAYRNALGLTDHPALHEHLLSRIRLQL